jgi:hypothetical protein
MYLNIFFSQRFLVKEGIAMTIFANTAGRFARFFSRRVSTFALGFCSLLIGALLLAGCGSVQGTKADYFGFRNSIPAPAPDLERQVGAEAWTNPMQSGVVSSVAFVPVVTPWYDGWSMFARPSLRFWSMYDRFAWNSPWGFGGDPFWRGGFGMGVGFGWGGNPWAFNSFFDPFWGCNSSFMFFSSPWQRFNPYFGMYTPFGFHRPLGWWGSSNFNSYNQALNTFGAEPLYSPSQMRTSGVQRVFGNNAASYAGANPYGNATYIGSYTSSGDGGALRRGGSGQSAEYKANNPSNRASQYGAFSSANGTPAQTYMNYYQNAAPIGSASRSSSYNPYTRSAASYQSSTQTTRYYTAPPSSSGGGRSGGGFFGSGGNSSYNSSSSSRGSSSFQSSGSSSGGGRSSGGYGSSSSGSSGSSSSGGARSRGGN